MSQYGQANNNSGHNAVLTAPVPISRLGRLARLGGLATTVAGGMLAEGARQLVLDALHAAGRTAEDSKHLTGIDT